MLRCILAVLAGLVLITVSLIPDDAHARRGGGGFRGGGGGFHGAVSVAAGCTRDGSTADEYMAVTALPDAPPIP